VKALLLCFKLQESRIAVVSSTAAATLRQLVMFVVDKVVDEDRRGKLAEDDLEEIHLPNGSLKKLGPSARDTFAVFEDLCLLANSEKPHFLRLDFLHKTFALELIESVLTNYHDLFRKVVLFLLSIVTSLMRC
jgi:Guanine nucleotide exchange factor in Golgi transport N-terminal/Dimerisation and cyclophilin-binding domain of Mon2